MNVQNVAEFEHVGHVVDFERAGSVEGAENKGIVVVEAEELEKSDDARDFVVAVVEYVVDVLISAIDWDMNCGKYAENAVSAGFVGRVALFDVGQNIEAVEIVGQNIEIAMGTGIEGCTGPADHSEIDEHAGSIEVVGFVAGIEIVKSIGLVEDIGIERDTETEKDTVLAGLKEIAD